MNPNIGCKLRRPLRLEGFSALCRVLKHAAYADAFPPTQNAFWTLHRDLQVSLREEKPEWIYTDRLHFRRGGEDVVLPVDMRNTQFIGADVSVPAFSGGYEPDIAYAIEKYAPDDGVFVDVGANWGYFPVYLASRPGFAGHIHAVEPAPAAFADLKRVVERFGFAGRTTLLQAALGDRIGEARLTSEVFTGNNRIAAEDGKVLTPLLTLDAAARTWGLSRLDFLKIDVEGAEAATLRGAAETLRRFKPVVVFEHWISDDLGACLDAFAASGVEDAYTFHAVADLDFRPEGEDEHGVVRVEFRGVLAELRPERRADWPERINILAIPASAKVRAGFVEAAFERG